MAYSADLRQRVLAAGDGPLSNRQVAELFQVSKGTVERWRRQRRETGQVSAGRSRGRPRIIPPDQEARLRAQVERMPDATLVEHCAQWAATTGVALSPASMCRALQSSFCHSIRPTSTRSNWPLPSSRPRCAGLGSGRLRACGRRSGQVSTASPHRTRVAGSSTVVTNSTNSLYESRYSREF